MENPYLNDSYKDYLNGKYDDDIEYQKSKQKPRKPSYSRSYKKK